MINGTAVAVKEKLRITGILSLDVPLFALLAWKACFIRFSFYTQERTGLSGWENIVFIVLCAGYALGVLTCGLIGTRLVSTGKGSRIPFCIAVAAAIPCTVLSANTRMMASLLSTFLAAFFAAFATGCCLYRLAVSLNRSKIGFVFGVSRAIAEVVTLLLCVQTFLPMPLDGLTVALCLLLAIAGLTFRSPLLSEKQQEAPYPEPDRKTMLKFAAILFVYCGVAGMLDNLYAFDGIFRAIPYFMLYIFLYSIGINLLVGFLFNRINWRLGVMAAIMLICAGQSLSFFSSVEALAMPYIALTTLGMVVMEVYTVALPVYYARDTNRPGLVCCLGLFAQYLGYGSTSVMFEFVPKNDYLFVLGIVLVAALAILMVLHLATGEEERLRYERMMDELRKLPMTNARDMGIDFTASFDLYNFTKREREVCAMLLSAYSLKQVAVDLHIAYSTANYHYTNLYRKLNINSRAELFQKFGVSADHIPED